ncbi:MAG TPA: hypothetical protein VLQ45_17790 [Thermoanaerobaculia bacterium]|nr:hypothetical protein [Thermoanaerobaculia bacterium]
MTEEPPFPPPPPPPAEGDRRLDSWKEIAAYFDRRVRTVQRWEKSEELPVHRLHHETGSSVYAYTSELDAWVLRRSAPPAPEETEGPAPAPPIPRRAARSLEPLLQATAFLLVCGLAAWTSLAVNRVLWKNDGFPTAPRVEKVILAFLPFTDLNPQPGFEHLSAGLTEDVLTGAAQVCPERVRLVGRIATERLEADVRLPEIARELDVDYLIEGYIQRDAGHVRVTIRVLDARREIIVQSWPVEAREADPFALQEKLVGRIVELLRDEVFQIF